MPLSDAVQDLYRAYPTQETHASSSTNHTASTRQHDLDHSYHTDQGSAFTERSR